MTVTNLRAMVGGRVVFNTRAKLLSVAILEQRRLCACSLKDLPPTQLCEGRVSYTVDLGAIVSGASTQQHSKSCLIVREGGRVTSPQRFSQRCFASQSREDPAYITKWLKKLFWC